MNHPELPGRPRSLAASITLVLCAATALSSPLRAQTSLSGASQALGDQLSAQILERAAKTRPLVAVLPFVFIGQQPASSPLVDFLAPSIATTLGSTGNIRVVEWSQIQKVIQAAKQGESGYYADGQAAAKLGKQLLADATVIGELTPFPSYLRVTARVVDVTTGEVGAAAGIFIDWDDNLRQLCGAPCAVAQHRPEPDKAPDVRPPAPPPDQAKPMVAKALDGTVKPIAGDCWEYATERIGISGRLFEAHATISYSCDSGTHLTFDVRGWDRFQGSAGIVHNDSRSNVLTILVDGEIVHEIELRYGQPPAPLGIDLAGHQTLSFQKSGRYPEVVIGDPKLLKKSP